MNFLIALIILVGILVCLATCCTIIYLIIEYFSESYGVKIKFKAFKRFYDINPNRWDLCDAYVICRITDSYANTKEYFCFSFIDYIKYKLWCHNYYKQEKERKDAKSVAQMLDCVREDIKKMELLSQQELEQAKREITNIFNR